MYCFMDHQRSRNAMDHSERRMSQMPALYPPPSTVITKSGPLAERGSSDSSLMSGLVMMVSASSHITQSTSFR
jgi:hypothetical protein